MITHLSVVVCDTCGRAGTQPAADAREARQLIPLDWARIEGRDFCSMCVDLPMRDTAHPFALPGLEDWR